MSADDTQSFKWYVDAAFAVHKDFKSQTGATFSLGNGIICSLSTKRKWTREVRLKQNWLVLMTLYQRCCGRIYLLNLFIEAQGHKVTKNVIYRDKTSAMKLKLACGSHVLVTTHCCRQKIAL